jgi:hypothetical protein
MTGLTTRQEYLHLVGEKRKAMIKGEKYHPHVRTSSKRRKIMKANNALIKRLLNEYESKF